MYTPVLGAPYSTNIGYPGTRVPGYPGSKYPRVRERTRVHSGSDDSGYPPPGTRVSVRRGATLPGTWQTPLHYERSSMRMIFSHPENMTAAVCKQNKEKQPKGSKPNAQWVERDGQCHKLEPEHPTCRCVCCVRMHSTRSCCGHQECLVAVFVLM